MDLNPAAVSEALREIAELHLYDGDTDQPLPGYQAAHDLADRLDKIVRATADAIADQIKAEMASQYDVRDRVTGRVHLRPKWVLSNAKYALAEAAKIARSFGSTAPEGPKP